MGCVCGKPSAIRDSKESPRPAPPPVRRAREPVKVSAGSSRRKDGAATEKKPATGPVRGNVQDGERRRERQRPQLRPAGGVPKGIDGELVAAGWPAWLAGVAGDAIQGWVPRRADSFEKLNKIGQGTYSNVYRARDLDNGRLVALKKVRFDSLESESVRFMAREIHVLRRLDHPNIVKLVGLVTSRMSCSLYLVFEYMEHDLTGLASFPGLKFTEPQIKCYMQQLLNGLDHCHSRGILHRDIKCSNLLIDNSGILKIADFGLASFFDPEQNNPLTSRVVTLWYRPPELLLGATKYGVAIDLWSMGCILAELYAGRPIMPGQTEVEQLHKIFKLCGSPAEGYWRKSKLPNATIFKPTQPYRRRLSETFKDFPPSTLALLEVLLSIDPADRGTAASALKSEFFTTSPLACDPSSLPKYPPSKELDAKLRAEEAKRQGSGGKVQRHDLEKRGLRDSRAIPAPEANAELVVTLQKRQGQASSKSRSEKFNTHHEEVASGFPMEPPRPSPGLVATDGFNGHSSRRSSHSGPMANRSQWKAKKKKDGASAINDLSSLSGLVAVRRNVLYEDSSGRLDSPFDEAAPAYRLTGSGSEPSDSLRKHGKLYHANVRADSHQSEDERMSNADQPIQQGFGSIQYSGPLLHPSGNVDQMLKDHEHQMQEVFRRSRMDKSKGRKVAKPLDLGVGPIYPSSRGSAPVYTRSRGAVE